MKLNTSKTLIAFITFFLFNFLFANCSDLPTDDNTLYVDADGMVYYNFTQDIAGFQFNVVGTTMTGA